MLLQVRFLSSVVLRLLCEVSSVDVEAHVYHWTPEGMQEHAPLPTQMGYIPVREVERLLQDVHARAQAQGYDQAATLAKAGRA